MLNRFLVGRKPIKHSLNGRGSVLVVVIVVVSGYFGAFSGRPI